MTGRETGDGGADEDIPDDAFAAFEPWRTAGTPFEREEAAAGWVRLRQRATGFEHAVVLREDGELLWAGTSGLARAVSTAEWRHRVGRGRVHVHHSHPDPVSLSPADLAGMWRDRSFGVVRALPPDDGEYRAEPLGPPELWLGLHRELIRFAGSELRVLSRRRNGAFAYLAHHLANGEMARRGHIWYEFSLPRAVSDDLDRLGSTLGDLMDGLRREEA